MKRVFITLLALVTIVAGARAQDMAATPLTLEAAEAGTINIVNPGMLTIEYNLNSAGWTAAKTNPISIAVAANDVVQFRGDNESYSMSGNFNITSTGNVYVYGNVMSLISSTNFATANTLTGMHALGGLFCAGWNWDPSSSTIPHLQDGYPTSNSTIRNHPTKDIVLPATQLSDFCYYQMFAGCTGLTRTPLLPATNLRLANGDYSQGVYAMMFAGCTGLTTAPTLPATIVGHNNYLGMFAGCTGLTAAPALPAMEMTSDLYAYMFADCTNLVTPPALPATRLFSMCYNHMFAGCTSLTTAPDLNAWKLADLCYWGMFEDCTSLNSVKCLARDISASDCIGEWMKGVPATGTFTKATPMTDWTTGMDGIPAGWTVVDGGISDSDMGYAPLSFQAVADGAITAKVSQYASFPGIAIEYQKNDGAWATVNWNEPISVNAGDVVRFHGNNASCADEYGNGFSFVCSNDCYVYGNVMSLLSSTDYATATTLTADYAFANLFTDEWNPNTTIKNHPDYDLFLPATTLSNYCYSGMFVGCQGLTRAPELPATVMADYCYNDMFNGCTGLTEVPMLPATTLAEGCYCFMFNGCTGLTNEYVTITLPATTLAPSCYDRMFMGCTSLLFAPMLPATTLANGCYSEMFMGCTSLMSGPALPAKTLVEGCYNMMFNGCTNLNAVQCMATDISADYCTFEWMDGVAAKGTFTKPTLMNEWAEGISGIPSGWTKATGTIRDGDMFIMPLCLEAIDDCTITIDCGGNNMTLSSDYLTIWSTKPYWNTQTGSSFSYTLSAGQQLVLKGLNSSYEGVSINSTGDFYVYGNIMSLVNGDDYATLPELAAANAFKQLFKNNTHVKSHPEKELILSAPTLTEGCYQEMFSGCTGINNIVCLATDITATDATTNWLSGVAATGTFTKPSTVTAWSENSPSGIPTGWTAKSITYVPPTFDAQGSPLTLETTEDATTIRVTNPLRLSIKYSTDGGNTSMTTNANPITISGLAAGTKVQFWGNNAAYATSTSTNNSTVISADKEVYAYGNVMSLVDATNFATNVTLTGDYAFANLFNYTDNNLVKSHPKKELLLPATTLTPYCYYQMFRFCKAMTTAPALPATALAARCYANMFWGCTTLTAAPELPATELSSYCYSGMFGFCNALITAPALPATTLPVYCYQAMFRHCTSLKTAPALPATIMASRCYEFMFYDCTSLETAPALPATTMADYCYNSMFYNCSSLTAAPALPAKTLSIYCYNDMFYGCTALTAAPVLPAATLVEGCYACMFSSCRSLNSVKCYATDMSAASCTNNWLGGVAATGTFVKAHSADWSGLPGSGMYVDGIPDGWTTDYVYSYTVPASGIGTFSATDKVELPDGLTAYYCTTFDGDAKTISLNAISGGVIPAETGVLLRGTAGETYTLTATADDAEAISGNALVAVVVPTHIASTVGDYTNFMLKSGEFIKIAESATTNKLAANKAYLQILTAALGSTTRGITLVWDDGTTGISQMEDGRWQKADVIYDLQGRQFKGSRLNPGVYIVNGKKVIIK